jgi:hypothetical protein
MEPSIHLDITSERWVKGLTTRRYPIKNWAFEAFRVIGTGAAHPLLNLSVGLVIIISTSTDQWAHHFAYVNNVLVRAIHDTILKTRHHLQQCLKYPVLASLSVGGKGTRKLNKEREPNTYS